MALRFNNSADYLERTTGIPAYNSFTIIAWVMKSGSTAGLAVLFLVAENAGGVAYLVGIDPSSGVIVLQGGDTDYSTVPLDVGAWYHVALTSDGSGLTVYLDGNNAVSVPHGTITPTRIQIGNQSENGTYFDGRIAALKIYNRAMVRGEIQAELSQYLPIHTSGLNSWQPMADESASSAVKDNSGAGNDFTLNGAIATEDGPPVTWRQAQARETFALEQVESVGQIALADGDISAGTWTTTPLWSKVNEAVADQVAVIQSAAAPVNDTCELSLTDLTDPVSSINHKLRVTRKKDISSGNQIDMRYRILQGTTEIASWTDDTNISDAAYSTVERTLTGGQADAITDYTNLRVEIRANQVTANPPAPTFNAAGAIAASATSGASITPALPAGFAADDIHIIVAHHSGSVDFTTPSGWTKITALSGTNTSAQIVAVFWRRAVGGDTAPAIAMASSVSTVRIARCYGFRSCITSGDPWDSGSGAGPTKLNNAASATVSTTSITTTVANCLVLFFDLYEDDPSARSLPSGYTVTGTVGTSALGTDASENCFRKALTGTGTENPSTTVSGGTFANSVNVGLMIALKPQPSASVRAQVDQVEFEAPNVEPANEFPAGFSYWRPQDTLLRT